MQTTEFLCNACRGPRPPRRVASAWVLHPRLPGGRAMAPVLIAITAGGALASVETTVLMTVEEMLEALAKGKDIGYRRPGE